VDCLEKGHQLRFYAIWSKEASAVLKGLRKKKRSWKIKGTEKALSDEAEAGIRKAPSPNKAK